MHSDDNKRQSLMFFGEVSASVSHDIKNVFAIINEDAGLLEDLSLMVEKGMPIDPAKLAGIASKIQKQIKRGDAIVKNMNTFAHSIDDPVRSIELNQTLRLVYELLKRKLASRGVDIEISDAPSVTVSSDPFAFEMLMARSLGMAMDCAGKNGKVVIRVEARDGGAAVILSGLDSDSGCYDEDLLLPVAKDVQAGLMFDKASGVLEITLPESLTA